MPERLHWKTVTPLLKSTLTELMHSNLFQSFRLVGGTSLSLQLGHRISIDIDLFTDTPYGVIDFDEIEAYLRRTFSWISDATVGPVGMGKTYTLGFDKENSVKLDLYYTETFIQSPIMFGPYRMATLEEIIAMKIDIIQRGGRKKDFWDLHELLGKYSITQMIALHAIRYPYGHDESVIRSNFVNFKKADDDFDPICLRGKYWELIKLDIADAIIAS